MEIDWGNLEALPLSLIFNKLVERIDHIYFSLVCKNWYSMAKFNYQNRQIKNNVLPMLMIPTKSKHRTKRNLYGISSNKIYNFKLKVPYNKRFCGFSHGWLAKVEYSKGSKGTIITLMNPFKKLVYIPLPPIYMLDIVREKKNCECNVHKITLSINPTTRPHDYYVAAIYSMKKCLAFLKAGQKLWTYIDIEDYCRFSDVIFYKGLFYAIGEWNDIVSFDLSNLMDGKVIPNVVSSKGDEYAQRAYIVKSLEGDLWIIRRFIDFPDDFDEDDDDDDGYDSNGDRRSGTRRFEVYKLELDLQTGKLIQMLKLDSLGDNVLFLGDNDSVSMSASYFSNYLQKDSIYYTDDYFESISIPYPNGPFDMGIYNVKDGSFSKHCSYQDWFTRMPPPLWVLPPFNGIDSIK
ncbi:uncharacterized protein LOC123915238 [Trifolium pratense]|uniref:uncharacterized protein LOC123915238 n=1 Tax=Trifolium pratense TaxID=57577 RepID=UPI001E696490|nr:uncharacterized protein LOC123915238 [Trifolium pratense]